MGVRGENDLLQTCVDLDLSWKAEEEEEELPELTRSYLLVLGPLSHKVFHRDQLVYLHRSSGEDRAGGKPVWLWILGVAQSLWLAPAVLDSLPDL